MTDIDYEALGDVIREFALTEPDNDTGRRVVAALRDQGLVVVGRDDVTRLLNALDAFVEQHGLSPSEAMARVRAALAAPGDGGEHP